MNANEVLVILIYSGYALLAGVLMVVVQAVFLDAETRIGRWLMPTALPLIICGIMLSTALTGRSLKYAALDLRTLTVEPGGGGGLLRVITAILLAISFAKILGTHLKFGTQRLETEARNKGLFYCFFAYFIGNIVLPSAFGAKPVFIHAAFYSIVLFSAVFMDRREPLTRTIAWVKYALLLMMLASMVLAVVKPDLVLEPNYKGLLPGLKVRLWGLGSNANSIGPLALTLLLLEVQQPATRRWVGWLCWISALAVMLLAQSKTVWAASFFVGLVVYGYRHGRQEGGGLKIGFVLLVISLLLVFSIGLMFVDVGRLLDKLNSTRAGADLTSLTGRAQVWANALRTWQESPAFGYGLTAWGPEFRMSIGMLWAFHSHNQFLQSASVAGTFGLLTLVIYFVALLRASIRAAARTRGVSLGMMAFIALRSMTEIPLDIDSLFVGETVMHLLLFTIVVNTAPAEEIVASVKARRSMWQLRPEIPFRAALR